MFVDMLGKKIGMLTVVATLLLKGDAMYPQSVPALISKNVGNTLTNYKTWNGVIYNIKDYGAKGDGVTDDTAAIQAAINAAPVFGSVWIPAGQFKVTQLDLTGRTGLTITGSGEIKGSANTVVTSIFGVFKITNASNITIDGIGISGTNAGADDRGVWVGDSYNVTIRNCRITNFGQEALLLWGANNSVESVNRVDDNYILGNNYGIKTQTNGEYWEISRNTIINNNYGIFGALGNCRVDNNKIIQNGYGIYLDSSLGSNPDHSSISGNQINHNKAVGLFLKDLVSGEQIVNNEILSTVGPQVWPTTGKSHGLVAINITGATFIGNRIDSPVGSTIYIQGQTECYWTNNTFSSAEVKEEIAGTRNYFMGNRYIAPSKLTLHASSTDTFRMAENVQGKFLGAPSDVINKIAVTTFLNSWINDAGYYPLTYWKDAEGCVHIQGSIAGGTIGTVVFNLPVDFRPSAAVDVIAIANNTGDIAGFRVYANGNMQQLSGGNTHVSINAMFKP